MGNKIVGGMAVSSMLIPDLKQTNPKRSDYVKNKQIFASAINNTTSGTAVALTGISPIEHTIGVKARSQNKFDISKATRTRLEVGTGEAVSNSMFFTSDYIEMKPNTAFVGNYIQGCAFYDINKAYISDIGEKSSSVERALTMPQNAYYMRFTYKASVTDGSNVKLEEGTVSTPYTHFVDVSTANVLRYGGNILPYPYFETTKTEGGIDFVDNGKGGVSVSGTATSGANFRFAYNTPFKAGTYTISYDGEMSGMRVYVVDTENTYAVLTDTAKSATFTLTKDSNLRIYLNCSPNAVVSTIIYPHLGIVATEYEPYKEPTTYPINTDGTVEGITSLYPTTTLMADTAGIVLDVEYYLDTKKYLDAVIKDAITTALNTGV